MNLEVDNGQLCDKALMYSQILKVSLHFTASRVGFFLQFKPLGYVALIAVNVIIGNVHYRDWDRNLGLQIRP